MTNYLVTGGGGFIGRHLCKALVQNGHQVSVIDKNISYPENDSDLKLCRWIQGDICDPILMKCLLETVEGCFHLAAIVSLEESLCQWYDTSRTNALGIINIFDIVSKMGKKIPIVFASSTATYSNENIICHTEDEVILPKSPYGVDKYAAEMHAHIAHQIFKIPVTVLRLFNVYGLGQDPSSPYAGVITKFLDCVKRDEPLEIFGDGRQTRDYIHVSDVVRFLMRAMDTADSNYRLLNVCTGVGTSLLDVVQILKKFYKKGIEVRHLPAREFDVIHSRGCPKRAKAVLEMESSISIEKGLCDLISGQIHSA